MRRATVLVWTSVLALRSVAAQETTRSFGDRRTVGGFNLPYLMTTTVGNRPLERVVFDEILANPELSRADFRIDRQ